MIQTSWVAQTIFEYNASPAIKISFFILKIYHCRQAKGAKIESGINMKALKIFIAPIVLVVASAAALLYNTEAGQDFLIDRAAQTMVNAKPFNKDALSPQALKNRISAIQSQRMAKIVSDVEDYHAHSTNLEAQTKAAGIKQLAFYHFVPVPNNPLILKIFERELSGNTIFTKDLMTFQMLPDSDEIIVSQP